MPGIRFHMGRIARVLMVRVKPPMDVIEGIEEGCHAKGIQAAGIVCCIGSLRKATFMYPVPSKNRVGAGYGEPVTMEGPVEILSGQGMIGREEDGALFVHLHGSFCDRAGHVQGGHLVKGGNPVLITVEIMVCEVDGGEILRLYDPEVDMKVLMPVG